MRRCRSAAEDEMVALFLHTEISAVRYRAGLIRYLEEAGLPERILTKPDLVEATQHAREERRGRAAPAIRRRHPWTEPASAAAGSPRLALFCPAGPHETGG